MRSDVNNSEMVNTKYSMAFTTCSLLVQESIKIAELYLEKEDWKEVSKNAVELNLLQHKTESSLKRTLSEILSRLKLIPVDAIRLLVNGDMQEQTQIMWFAVCLRYRFIFEFASEVIREKYSIMQLELTQFDYDAFFNEKYDLHEEVREVTDTTRYKLKQVLFKMLKETGIIDGNNLITPIYLSPMVEDIIVAYDKEYLKIFPN